MTSSVVVPVHLDALDTNPEYVDILLGEDGDSDPQLCLMMPDRDRQYNYTIINQGAYGLSLRSVEKIADLEKEDRMFVIVASVGGKLHVRIFDSDGKIVDKPQDDLVYENGEESGKKLKSEEIPWKTKDTGASGGGTLKIKKLADEIKRKAGMPEEITSARFALQMIEGNELVRFSVT